jgi:hypothetical protein
MKVSQLHGNLVFLFYDYLTESPFLSFIGNNMLSETVRTLLDYSAHYFKEPCLKLIPETVAVELCTEAFIVTPDDDSHDYIFSVQHLRNLDKISGGSDEAARCLKNYLKLYDTHTIRTYSGNDIPAKECICLFKEWAKMKSLNHLELNEYSAFVRFITNAENGNTILGIYDGNVMIGFIAYEIVSKEYAIGHFSKANTKYRGIYEALLFYMSERLQALDIPYYNFEQDLGIPQLRQSKKKYKPVFYLKKFTVQKRQL